MSSKSSGTYVIDADYNVVEFNQTIMELYPQLKKGRKCYECLMNLSEPCPPCPVANHIHGPQTYMDPIRGIYETVDAVDLPMPDGGTGHALVMSTVGESETIAARLPRTKDELTKLLDQEYFDTLTDGYSRKGFIRETERIFSRTDRTEYAVIIFDIRNFKAINDIFGIDGGDQVLKCVYHTLKNSWLKPVVSARVESDWFLFLIRKKSLEDNQAESLLSLEWNRGDTVVHLHLRCGIYPVDDRDVSVSRMVEWAIMARGVADQQVLGSCAVFSREMRKAYVDRAEIISAFQSSLEKHDFKVYFQPIVRADDGRMCSAEALIRWQHPTMGFVSPGVFIPALEKNGLISQLDRYVVEHVCAFQKSVYNSGLKCVPVSVNLSRQDFYDEQLMNEIFNLAEDSSLPKGFVNYEVTETSVAVLKQHCTYLLEQIRKAGSYVLLDDFGSGYSSLGMIGDYSFDIVKIDKSFVDQIDNKPNVRAVISSTIDMCHRIGLKTVAEGVEVQNQADFLREQGCDYIQGYLYARPMCEEDFLAYLSTAQNAITETDSRTAEPGGKDVDFYNLTDLIDHSGQFIQVCRPEDYTMVFANRLTRLVSGHPEEPYQGRLCYQYMNGLDAPCGHCPMKQMGNKTEKNIEVDDGEHVYSLKGRYTTWNGRKVFIEYGRDVTSKKMAHRRYADRISSILENIPEGQGVFHVDLTEDSWISSGGNAQNARDMQNMDNVDALIHRIASFVPDKEGQDRFFRIFSRESELAAYKRGSHQIVCETESYYDDMSIRWSRITAHLIDNPENGHVESIIYGVDISREKAHVEELEREREQSRREKEELQKEVAEAWNMYTRADRDRRYDPLTGLNSRLDLYDEIRRSRQGEAVPVKAVLMMDIDDFKKINDTCGHASGDICLAEVGKTIRQFGSDRNVIFYRFGGEEIVGFVHNRHEDIAVIVQDLWAAIHDKKIRLESGKEISLTASIGYTVRIADYQEMINTADRAMYVAKNRGKDQTACID